MYALELFKQTWYLFWIPNLEFFSLIRNTDDKSEIFAQYYSLTLLQRWRPMAGESMCKDW